MRFPLEKTRTSPGEPDRLIERAISSPSSDGEILASIRSPVGLTSFASKADDPVRPTRLPVPRVPDTRGTGGDPLKGLEMRAVTPPGLSLRGIEIRRRASRCRPSRSDRVTTVSSWPVIASHADKRQFAARWASSSFRGLFLIGPLEIDLLQAHLLGDLGELVADLEHAGGALRRGRPEGRRRSGR